MRLHFEDAHPPELAELPHNHFERLQARARDRTGCGVIPRLEHIVGPLDVEVLGMHLHKASLPDRQRAEWVGHEGVATSTSEVNYRTGHALIQVERLARGDVDAARSAVGPPERTQERLHYETGLPHAHGHGRSDGPAVESEVDGEFWRAVAAPKESRDVGRLAEETGG